MSPSRSRRAALLTTALFLAALAIALFGCAPKETAPQRTSEQMRGGGPPAPESHRPASVPTAP